MKLLSKLFSKEKKQTIEFCEKNLDRFLKEESVPRYQAYLSGKNIEYKEYQCQSRCKECKEGPYAVVNGEFIQGKDSDDLLEKLKAGRG